MKEISIMMKFHIFENADATLENSPGARKSKTAQPEYLHDKKNIL
jgi:hypothetical protein